MNKNIVQTQIQANQQILNELGVKKLILFGSVAREEATQISDIDFLVHFQKPSSFDQYMNLKIYLEDLFGCQIDLVTTDALRERLKLNIEQDAVYVIA